MGSKLSSMLVHEGLLSMKDLEEVFARQVILGGLLDTILLEKALVPEATLVSMLAEVTGLPALQPSMLEFTAGEAEVPFDEPTATRIGVCPLPGPDDGFRVLVSETTDLVALDELAFEIGRPVTAVVGPEVRVYQSRSKVYGSALPGRLATLLKKVGELPPTPARLPPRRPSAPAEVRPKPARITQDWAPAAVEAATADSVVGQPEREASHAKASTPEPSGAAAEAEPLPEMPPIPEDAFEPGEEGGAVEEVLVPHGESVPDEFGSPESPLEPFELADGASEALVVDEARTPLDIALPADLAARGPSWSSGEPADSSERTIPSARALVEEASEEHMAPAAPPLPEESAQTPAEPKVPLGLGRVGSSSGLSIVPRASYSELELSCAPLTVDEASLAMRSANNRDELLFALACGAHRHLEVVQVYALKGHLMVGQFELNNGVLDTTEIRGRTIDLKVPSVVSRSAAEGNLYIGPVPDTDASPMVLFTAGILEAKMVALVPVLIRGRPICLVVGHSESKPIPMTIRAPLAKLAEEAALALAAHIVRQKHRPPSALGVPSLAVDPALAAPPVVLISPVLPHGDSGSASPASEPPAAPSLSASPARSPAEPSVSWEGSSLGGELTPSPISDAPAAAPTRFQDLGPEPQESTPFDALIEALDRGPAAAKLAEEGLLAKGKASILALVERFPGRLRFDRSTLGNLLPPVGECSSLLKALISFGRPVISTIAPLLHHQSIDTRFYAAYLLSELVYPESVALLATRLQDRDLDVRRIAIRTLHKYRELSRFKEVLGELRNDLTNPEARPRKAAIEALAAMGDSASVPDLVEMLSDPDRVVARAALDGLVSLTKRDFSLNRREWLAWWELSKSRHRIEWLIDGLLHADANIRESSVIELEALSGLRLGFRLEMPRGELEVMRNRYIEWWDVEGARLFGGYL